MTATSREILDELDKSAERIRALGLLEDVNWIRRAADHIEFLETQLQTDKIDAVEWDDRKVILDVFNDTLPGTITIDGPLRGGLYDKLLAVARWGAQQAFERMTERRA